MKLQKYIDECTIEQIRAIPSNIATIAIFDNDEYLKRKKSELSEDVKFVNDVEHSINKIRISNNFIGLFRRGNYFIYISAINNSKIVTERSILKFLKGDL